MCAAVIGAAGLARVRIHNSLEAWSPGTGPDRQFELYVVVGFESHGVDASDLQHKLGTLPWARWCVGPASKELMAVWGIDPRGLVAGADGRYAGIYLFADPSTDPGVVRSDVDRILRETAGGDTTRFTLGGSAAFAASLSEASRRRMAVIVPLITVGGGLMLWRLTGSVRAGAAGLGAIGCAVCAVMGAASWAGIDVDMSLMLVPPLMVSLGYSYAAHAAMRTDATKALIVCGVTSACGIAAFGAAEVPSIRAFALWGTIGIGVVWTSVMSLVVPVPATTPRRETTCDRHARHRLMGVLRAYDSRVVIAGLLVAVAGVCLAPKLRIHAQPLEYFSKTDRIVRDNAVLEARLGGMLPFEVVSPKGVDVAAMIAGSRCVRTAIDVSVWVGGRDRTLWCLADNDSVEALEVEFKSWTAREATLRLRGVAPQLLDVRQRMRRVAAESIPAMLIVAGLAVGVVGGSVRAGIFGILVNLMPVAGAVVLLRVCGEQADMPTLMVGAIGIGAGIDDAIHVAWLFRRHSMSTSLRICLRACLGSSGISAVCMGEFAISPFRPTAQFGLLMAAILVFAAISDLLVLPALFMIAERRARMGGHRT